MVDRRELAFIGHNGLVPLQFLTSAITYSECDQQANTKIEFGRAVLLLEDLMDWLKIIEQSCPWLFAQFEQTFIDLIQQTKASLIQLQTLRLEQFSEDKFISSDLFIYIGINVENQHIFINLRGFPTLLAGEFVEFVRQNYDEMGELFAYYDEVVKPKLIEIGKINLDLVFCNYDKDDPNMPQALDPDWK